MDKAATGFEVTIERLPELLERLKACPTPYRPLILNNTVPLRIP